MERLTKRDYHDFAIPIRGTDAVSMLQTIDRLAAIEDILGDEYDLNRLRELAQADREGRCGIPPVKLYQKIFRVFNGKIYEEIVCGAIWEPLMPQPRWKVFVMGGGLPYFWHEVFGKSVFLAHAEAEAALRREKHEKSALQTGLSSSRQVPISCGAKNKRAAQMAQELCGMP